MMEPIWSGSYIIVLWTCFEVEVWKDVKPVSSCLFTLRRTLPINHRMHYQVTAMPNEVDKRTCMPVTALDFAYPTCYHSWSPVKIHLFSHEYYCLSFPIAQAQRKETTSEGITFLGGTVLCHFLRWLMEVHVIDWHRLGCCVSVLHHALLNKAALGKGRSQMYLVANLLENHHVWTLV